MSDHMRLAGYSMNRNERRRIQVVYPTDRTRGHTPPRWVHTGPFYLFTAEASESRLQACGGALSPPHPVRAREVKTRIRAFTPALERYGTNISCAASRSVSHPLHLALPYRTAHSDSAHFTFIQRSRRVSCACALGRLLRSWQLLITTQRAQSKTWMIGAIA